MVDDVARSLTRSLSPPLAPQAAFIMSRLRKPPDDETQETLRTTNFPTTHIKEKWDNNLYIQGIAYGKTVS